VPLATHSDQAPALLFAFDAGGLERVSECGCLTAVVPALIPDAADRLDKALGST